MRGAFGGYGLRRTVERENSCRATKSLTNLRASLLLLAVTTQRQPKSAHSHSIIGLPSTFRLFSRRKIIYLALSPGCSNLLHMLKIVFGPKKTRLKEKHVIGTGAPQEWLVIPYAARDLYKV